MFPSTEVYWRTYHYLYTVCVTFFFVFFIANDICAIISFIEIYFPLFNLLMFSFVVDILFLICLQESLQLCVAALNESFYESLNDSSYDSLDESSYESSVTLRVIR